jgi:hypothetical protein
MPKLQYFWYWDRSNSWPPAEIENPESFLGGDRLCLACTQTGLTSSAQAKLVKK